MSGLIYMATCKISGKSYIGQTINGLKGFCRENKLNYSHMIAVVNKRLHQHKGYRLGA